MIDHRKRVGILAIASGIALTVPLLVGFQRIADTLTRRQLNDQSIMALNWMQRAGEYTALCHQAFNTAQIAFDAALNLNIKSPAVVVDIDETVLDNSPYQAGLIDTDNKFSSDTWNLWVREAKAKAVPGAVDFVNYVNARGGKVFFVSDRSQGSTPEENALERATIENLKALGFTGVNEETVILREEFASTGSGKASFSKQFRRQAIERGRVDGIAREIVVLVGDNLNDLDEYAGDSDTERRTHAEKNRGRYGRLTADNRRVEAAQIVLPNPVYGSWETGIYRPEVFGKTSPFDMTPAEIDNQRRNALEIWRSP